MPRRRAHKRTSVGILEDGPELRKLLYGLAKRGHTIASAAECLCVHESTLARLMKESKTLRMWYRRGRGEDRDDLLVHAKKVAMNEKHRHQGPMLMFLLKNRAGYSDRPEIEDRGLPGEESLRNVETAADLAKAAATMTPEQREDYESKRRRAAFLVDDEPDMAPTDDGEDE